MVFLLCTQLPDLRNVEEVQKFFIDEVQKGEELLGQGNYDEGVEHLTNAVAVCGQPQQLLQILQQTLPQPVFAMLLERLPSVSQVSLTISLLLESMNARAFCPNLRDVVCKHSGFLLHFSRSRQTTLKNCQ